uniref:Uncharacterized protein n=1 Tax=Glossina austeni TaxID=7395 RepID=A0A1A9VYV7_GLOAU
MHIFEPMFTHSVKLMRLQGRQSNNNARVSEEHSTPGHPGKNVILLSREIDIKMTVVTMRLSFNLLKTVVTMRLPFNLLKTVVTMRLSFNLLKTVVTMRLSFNLLKTIVTMRFRPECVYVKGRNWGFRNISDGAFLNYGCYGWNIEDASLDI